MNLTKKINTSIYKLSSWLDKYTMDGVYYGHDPFDTKECINKLKKHTLLDIPRKVLIEIDELINPKIIHKLFNIKPKINPKGQGLLMYSFAHLYELEQDPQNLIKAKNIAKWLKNNSSKNYDDLCWGYPFDWHSKIFIPKDTPSTIVTTAIGDGLHKLHTITKEQKYLDDCMSICNFLDTKLNISKEKNNTFCISYTPIDHFQVHNANLFTAEFLIRIGTLCNNQKWIDKGLKAAMFSVNEIKSDGSLYYWSKNQNKNAFNSQDIYHSGFEIRCLYNIWKTTQNKIFEKAYKNYLAFFTNKYFTNEKYLFKFTPNKTFPVDIHSCSEAIITLTTVIKDHPEYLDLLNKSINWTIDNMQSKKGWYIYRIVKKSYFTYKINFPYLRWGQSWMLRALSSAYEISKKN